MVKFSNRFIERVIKSAKTTDGSVVIGPAVGEDAAIIKVDKGYLAMHTDPVTGSSSLLGWLAVNVAANDVATRGIKPRWFLITLLMPSSSSEDEVSSIMAQVNEALVELDASLVGGHTEKTDSVTRPVAVATAVGIGDFYIRTGGLRPGDVVVMTKYAALEATAILASDFADKAREVLSSEELAKARDLYRQLSVIKEALAAAKYATSMHDPTEGGVLQGLIEMAYASKVLIRVYEERIPILPVTRKLLSFFNLSPLKVLSSGTLLIGVPREKLNDLLSALGSIGVNVSVIGEADYGKPGVLLKGIGAEEWYDAYVTIPDAVLELWYNYPKGV